LIATVVFLLTVGSIGVVIGLWALGKMVEKEGIEPIPSVSPKQIEPREIEPVTVREKEFVKEVVVKVRCPYCGFMYDETLDRCPHCGGRR
jgi:DNA-directed RNA polymerase subunit RPC12/RpoP